MGPGHGGIARAVEGGAVPVAGDPSGGRAGGRGAAVGGCAGAGCTRLTLWREPPHVCTAFQGLGSRCLRADLVVAGAGATPEHQVRAQVAWARRGVRATPLRLAAGVE